MTADLSLHLVTDHRVPFWLLRDIVDAAVIAGVSVVQLRDKEASGGELLSRALDLADVVAGRCTFVVDDRLDVVLAARDRVTGPARVDGIHLGQSDLPVDAARALLGPDALVGWTANTPEHLSAAAALPVGTIDYLGVGVIRATTTKPDHPQPLGVDGFGGLAASTAPSAAPAPTSVCSSSMNRMIRPSESSISRRTAFSRSSNSPRYFEPAIMAPRSSATTARSRRP